MKGFRLLRQAAVGLACLGVVAPQCQLMAATPQKQIQTSQAPLVHDVKLTAGGTLTGHVVDAQGVGTEGAAVSIRAANSEIAGAVTDASGRYVVTGLQGGVYQVVSGQGSQFVRAWAPNTAPPAARDASLLVSADNAVRGQGTFGVNGVEAATLGISIAALVVSIITLSKVNDNGDTIVTLGDMATATNNDVLEILESVSP